MTSGQAQAFYDMLNCAAGAVLAREGWDAVKAETLLLEASVAASEVYPLGSPQSATLGDLLALVAEFVTAVPF